MKDSEFSALVWNNKFSLIPFIIDTHLREDAYIRTGLQVTHMVLGGGRLGAS